MEEKEPVVASYYGMLIFWSQMLAMDCATHRFGRNFIDSDLPSERKPANANLRPIPRPCVGKT
jgi:hypothetical protein